MAVRVGGDFRFVGRSGELGEIVDALRDEDGSVVLVSGEPGMGKSRLVREALERSGASTLVGSSSPTSFGRPFDVLRSAIEPAVRWWTEVPPELAGAADSLPQVLGAIAPRLVAADRTAPRESEASRDVPVSDPVNAAVAVFKHLEPAVVVIEDLHWADVESLQVLERVLTAPDRPNILVTYRPEELYAGHPALELIRHAERRQPIRIRLEPLIAEEVSEMVAAAIGHEPDDRLVDVLLARTGGNPLYLEEFLVASRGDAVALLDSDLPWSLSEAIDHRLADLADDERSLLVVAAVIGSSVDYEVLCAAAGIDDQAVLSSLRTLVARGLLEERTVDRFHFRHELVREAILASLLGREKRQLHDQAFDAVVGLCPNDHAEIARHAIGAGRGDDVARLAPLGVRHYLEAGSPYQALMVAEQALAEFPDHPELRELAARSAWLLGRLDVARRHADRWHRIERRRGSERWSESLALVGRLAFEARDHDAEREAMSELSVGAVDDAPVEQRARALVALAQHYMLHQQVDAAVEHADRAIELADAIDDEEIRRLALVERASALLKHVDDAAAATEQLAELAAQSERAGDYLTAARALFNLSTRQAPDEAERTLAHMRRVAIRSGSDVMAVHSYAARRTELAIARGDLHGALNAVRRSRVLGGDSRWLDSLTALDATLTLETDDVDEAASILSGVADAVREREPWIRALLAAILAPDLDELRAGLVDLTELEQLADVMMWVTRHLLARGFPAEGLMELTKELGGDSEELTVVRAVLDERLGAADATTGLEAGLDWLDRPPSGVHSSLRGSPAMRAELLISMARSQLREGDRQRARDTAAAAVALLDNWPGSRRNEATELAATDRRASEAGSELTGRELDVAAHVAKGMTNGEIAEALFISRKTVSTHVSHILAKLRLSTRTQIARWYLAR